ncbi:fumarylacetoacetate hydrolase family protein [Arthrobacter globiformis NBRC 12137]|uniref:Fumarylacetoacetate hydrolase family protein n=1 Tax=Arthrobacter globiformis (strain ATCC 8010 / DSM 20124 / JCM 1332 / NBRC 12137 / NCIMB 8907 / NRRL B-2979 / 168) TaxID=1077972 RepID=H0QTN5_ARTG1|nr:fumarylacetoacetate hydrolase family protein [Arthrobacter globiformis]GAB16186.1 fumarylacetoacetate hydrolase family protein [Arthrobacter globiformis NBRC 12137]
MELMRLGEPGQERPVAKEGEKYFDLRGITADIDGGFLANDGIAKAREAVKAGLPEVEDAASLRIGAPVARPGAVLCIGQNYAAHAAESGDAPPSVPILFFKHPNTVVGAFDHVVIPPGAEKVDWEVELAVVIGKRASYLESPEKALDYVAGYAVSNDVSERAFQVEHSGGQWSKGKCCPTFNPLGPALVPADEVGDPQQLRLRSAVNGETRQDSNTSDMIFSVAYIIWHLSQYLVLEPGDIINTGTPQGVAISGKFPYLREGDRMEISIEKLGRQEQKLVSYTKQ